MRWLVIDVDRMDLRRLVPTDGNDVLVGGAATAKQLLAPFVVDADNTLGGLFLREQAGLGFEISFERMMVIEMILRQVGERSDSERGSPRAQQIKRVA